MSRPKRAKKPRFSARKRAWSLPGGSLLLLGVVFTLWFLTRVFEWLLALAFVESQTIDMVDPGGLTVAVNTATRYEDMGPYIIAPLITALLLYLIGGLLTKHGLDRLKQLNLTPQRTKESLEENKQWIKNKVA